MRARLRALWVAHREYREARKALRENTRQERFLKVTEETPEYRRLNAEVNDRRAALPWVLR